MLRTTEKCEGEKDGENRNGVEETITESRFLKNQRNLS